MRDRNSVHTTYHYHQKREGGETREEAARESVSDPLFLCKSTQRLCAKDYYGEAGTERRVLMGLEESEKA